MRVAPSLTVRFSKTTKIHHHQHHAAHSLAQDVDDVDMMLPRSLDRGLYLTLQCLSGIAIACISVPLYVFCVPVLLYVFVQVNTAYRAASREIQRLMATARSPCISALEQLLGGLTTVRAPLDRVATTKEFDVCYRVCTNATGTCIRRYITNRGAVHGPAFECHIVVLVEASS